MVVEKTGSGTNIIIADSGFFKTSTLPQKFLKITADVDSSTTGSWYFRSMFGSATAGIFDTPETDLTAGQTMSAYGLMDNTGAKLRLYGTGSVGTKLVLNSFEVKEVLQSEVSDTYYTLVDVNEPVLGAELVANGTMEADSNWSNYNSPTTNERSSEQAHSGTYSRKFTTDANYEGIISDGYTTTTGKHYIVSFWVYPTSITSIRVRMQEGDGSGDIATSSTTNPTFSGLTLNAWNQVSFNYQESSGGSSGKIVMESGGNTGSDSATYYIDDVTVKELQGNAGKMTNMASADLVYSSVLPDQSFLVGNSSPYNFITLDGSDEHLTFDSSGLPNLTPYTITAWFKSTDIDQTQAIVLWGDQATNERRSMIIYNGGGGSDWTLVASINGENPQGSTTLVENQIYHGAVTVNPSTKAYKIYLDGSLDGSGTYSSSLVAWSGGTGFIGRSHYGEYFEGDIYSASVWSKELSASEISAIHAQGRHYNLLDSYSDNLKGYWAMSSLDASTGLSDVGDGTIYDRSGQSNHGTATNTESADLASSPNAEPNGYAKGDTNRSTTKP